MSGFTEEPVMHRQAPCDITVFVDFEDIAQRQLPSEIGLRAPYPSSQRLGMWDIQFGEVVHRRRGAYLSEPHVYGAAGLAGTGVEAASLFPDNPEMIKAAIKSNYDILGLCTTPYNHATDAADQGIVVACGGTITTDKLTEKLGEPGQIARVDLPPDNPDFASGQKHSLSGKNLGKYPWIVCPEDYQTPGDSLLAHIATTLEDSDRWRQCMGGSSNLEVHKWLAAVKACCDSSLMDGLLMIYVLMRKGFLEPKNPETTVDPYTAPPHEQYGISGGITEDMKPDEYVVRLAELLSVQDVLDGGIIPNPDQAYFNALRRTILSTQYYNGKYRTFEFGRERGRLLPTRDTHTGAVTKTTPQGSFLHKQLNHFRIRMGAELQALDDHARFRLGYYISGPNRRAKVNLVLRATAM